MPGGQRVHGQPGLGGPEPIAELAAKCMQVNQATLRSAQGKNPRTEADLELAKEAWQKMQKDIQNGHAGTPISVHQLDLGSTN